MKIISNTKNDSIKRVEEIYKVLKKNDFGYLIEENTFFKNFPFLKDTKRGKYKELPDESIPKRIKDVLEELGPTYIKLGQMLSTRPDLIGVEIAKELESLRDNTPTTPFNEIKEVIEKELGKPINEIYKEIDEEPLGSASIGQVHKGILLENNKEVAIKVQKPNVRETIESDLKIMKFLSDKIGKYINQTKVYNIPSILTEFERSIFKEIDYHEELINMKNLAHNFRAVHYIHIPAAYSEYCSGKIITMELIKGKEVSEVMVHDYPEYNKKLIAKRGVKSYFKQIMIDGFFPCRPTSRKYDDNGKQCLMLH